VEEVLLCCFNKAFSSSPFRETGSDAACEEEEEIG